MPGNICGGIFSRKAYFGVFANLNFRELPQFYRPLPILVDRSPTVYNLFTQCAEMTQEFVCESCMRVHHIYKDVWVPDPTRPEVLTCVREAENDADPYSVAMISSSMTVVGHESMAEEGTFEDSAPCGLGTAESHLK